MPLSAPKVRKIRFKCRATALIPELLAGDLWQDRVAQWVKRMLDGVTSEGTLFRFTSETKLADCREMIALCIMMIISK